MKLALALTCLLACGPSSRQGPGEPTDDTDNDGDGASEAMGDCDDSNADIGPNNIENCTDGIDNDCDAGIDGADTACMDPCDRAAAERSSVGCVYYGLDTNALGQAFAIAVSNVNDEAVAVSIESKVNSIWQQVPGGALTVGPLSVITLNPDRNAVDGSVLRTGAAYRVTADLPVIAYQFSPFDGSVSYLSDASLLLPVSAWDTVHLVPAWPSGIADGFNNYPAHVQIVASGPTQVTVNVPEGTIGGNVAALPPGTPSTFTLEDGDVLQLGAIPGQSLDGAYITSTAPVGVFSSNNCADVPNRANSCCCEHLEEQIFGLQTWGTSYVAAQMPLRGVEPSIYRILAQEDNTTITFTASPNVTGLPPFVTLNARQRVEFEVSGSGAPADFFASSDKPFHINQFTVGATVVLAGGSLGDPDMIQAIPTEQYLNRYVVLVPNTWIFDFAVLVRPVGAVVSLDSAPINVAWRPVGASGFEAATVPVSDGVHVLESLMPFGVSVSGYDEYDSYSYPGGLNQQVINPIE